LGILNGILQAKYPALEIPNCFAMETFAGPDPTRGDHRKVAGKTNAESCGV